MKLMLMSAGVLDESMESSSDYVLILANIPKRIIRSSSRMMSVMAKLVSTLLDYSIFKNLVFFI